MEELISRQQAMDAIKEAYENYEMFDGYEYRIQELPSIEPEIIHCKDCKWWTKQRYDIRGRCALLGMYPTSGWFCGNADRITK